MAKAQMMGDAQYMRGRLFEAAHNNAKANLKTKTKEEISKSAGNFGIPGFKWPL